jgi:hypothetical protein
MTTRIRRVSHRGHRRLRIAPDSQSWNGVLDAWISLLPEPRRTSRMGRNEDGGSSNPAPGTPFEPNREGGRRANGEPVAPPGQRDSGSGEADLAPAVSSATARLHLHRALGHAASGSQARSRSRADTHSEHGPQPGSRSAKALPRRAGWRRIIPALRHGRACDPIRGAEADAPDPSSTPTARRPRRDAPVLVTWFRLASAASVP